MMKNYYRVDGDVTYITLNRKVGPDVEAVIDTADLPLVDSISGTWGATLSDTTRTFYVMTAHRRNNYVTNVRLHNLIMEPAEGLEVDHINRNSLDNRRANLRCVTRSENCKNRRPWGTVKKQNRIIDNPLVSC